MRLRTLARRTRRAGAGGGGIGLLAARHLDHLVALRAQLQEGLGFDVEPGQIAIDNGLPDHAECGLGAEVVLVVERCTISIT
jgi:hypothetical protein